MNPFIQKIAVVILACLLALNLASGDAVSADPCLPHFCCSGPMDMGHHDGLINFALPMQGCCEDCNDIFCDLMKDPLQDVNAVNSSPLAGHFSPAILATADAFGQSGRRDPLAESRHLFTGFGLSNQIPLYLENLALII